MTTLIIRFRNPIKGIYYIDDIDQATLAENNVLPTPGHQSYEAGTVHGEHMHYSAKDAAQRLAFKTKQTVIAEMYDGQGRIEASYYVYPGTLTLQTGAACYQAALEDLGEDLGGFSLVDLLADNFEATLADCQRVAGCFKEFGFANYMF